MPGEVLEAHMLEVLGVPIASGWAELQRVPARIIWQRMLIRLGKQDAQEWLAIEAKKNGGK